MQYMQFLSNLIDNIEIFVMDKKPFTYCSGQARRSAATATWILTKTMPWDVLRLRFLTV